jgi:hypothetical protein
LLDVELFNNSLSSNRLPLIANTASAFGVTGGVFIKRFWFGGEAAWQFGANGSNKDYELQLYGGNGMVKGGYILVDQAAFVLYPSLGLGGGGTAIQVSSAAGGSAIEGSMIMPGRNLHSGYMLVDPALNGDFFFGDHQGPSRLLVGFAIGYLLSPVQSRWDYGDEPIPSLRKFAPQGLYVKVKLGWNKVR